jgi:hypothetical protein
MPGALMSMYTCVGRAACMASTARPSPLPAQAPHHTAPFPRPAAAGGGAAGAGPGRAFNPACPDGPYALDLSAAGERAVAVALAEMDAAAGDADLMRGITLDGKVRGAGRAELVLGRG